MTAYLQFLNGERAEDFVELHPEATLVVGSAETSHIRLTDPEVAPRHCQVYPGDGGYWLQDLGAGATIHDVQRLIAATARLRPYDVVILGKTFVRFLAEPPRCVSCGNQQHEPAPE